MEETIVLKKDWNKTKPIMVCNVINFFLLIALGINRAASLGFKWFILFLFLTIVLTILSVTYAWDLEQKI